MHQDTDFFYLSYLGLTKWEFTVPLESVDSSASVHRILSDSLSEHSLCCSFFLFPQRCTIKHTVDCLSLHLHLYSTHYFLLPCAGLKILLIFPLFINSWFNLYRVCYQQLSELLASIMKQYSHGDSITERFQTHIPFHSFLCAAIFGSVFYTVRYPKHVLQLIYVSTIPIRSLFLQLDPGKVVMNKKCPHRLTVEGQRPSYFEKLWGS